MAQARKSARPSISKRSPLRKARAHGDEALLGASLLVRAGKMVTSVPVSKKRFDRIVHKERFLGKVISGYADVAAKAARTGEPIMIAYKVTPDGKVEAVVKALINKPEDGPLAAAIARAKARGATKSTEILKGADMLTARDFGRLIGASHETVNVKRKRHDILGLEGATRGVKYPRWQITDAGLPLPGLARLFGALGAQPWTVYRFLRAAHAELGGRTALDALKGGQIDAVVGVAESQAAGAFS